MVSMTYRQTRPAAQLTTPLRRMRATSLLVAVSVALTACGGNESENTPTTSTSSGGSASVVEWVDGFCGAVNGFVNDQNDLPTPAEGNSVKEIQRQTSTLLGSFVDILDKAIAALAALPKAPNSTAETAARTATDNYTSARDTAATAKVELDAASPDNVDAQNRAVDALIKAQEQAHNSLDPVSPLAGSPELVDAAAGAPNCSLDS